MPEQQNIEYKTSWCDDYLKWICGFANAQGVTLEKLKQHHSSRPRNLIIADVCFKGGLIDAWGKGRITNSDYQGINEISDRTSSRDLEDLVAKSVLRKVGDKKSTSYEI